MDSIGSKQNHITGSGYPMGAVRTGDGVQFTTCLTFKKTLELLIYNKKGDVIDHVNMADHVAFCGTCSCIVKGQWDDNSYCYEVDGIRTSDPFMSNSTALRKFGDDKAQLDNGRIYEEGFDWGDDRPLHIPYNDVIA